MIDGTLGNSQSEHGSGVARRTIVKGAAWSLPVIAVAATTPAASASTTDACQDTPLNVGATSHAWNDGNGGLNAIGVHEGSHLYGPSTPLFSDFRMVNYGPATAASFQVAWTAQADATNIDPNNVVMTAILPDGTEIPYSAIDEYAVVDNAPERRRFTFSFYDLLLAPGQEVIFRTRYLTAPTTGGNYAVARPFATGHATSILCDGREIRDFELTHGDDLSDNYAEVPNVYWVQGA